MIDIVRGRRRKVGISGNVGKAMGKKVGIGLELQVLALT